MKRFASALTLVLLVSACSSAPAEPPAPPVLDPTGEYGITIAADGFSMNGTMTITDGANELTGTMQTEMGDGTLSQFVIEGQEVTFIANAQGMTVSFWVVFEGDGFSGEFETEGFGAAITGVKR